MSLSPELLKIALILAIPIHLVFLYVVVEWGIKALSKKNMFFKFIGILILIFAVYYSYLIVYAYMQPKYRNLW